MEKWIICALAAINMVTFILYGWDKQCARKGRWRVPEKVLLGFAFFGGSVGALLGMRAFRHKTKHIKFMLGIPIILVCQIIVLLWAARQFGLF